MCDVKMKVIAYVLAAGCLFVGQAFASPATGTNPHIPADGKIYIPLTPATSGMLGVGTIGLVGDSVTLSGIGDTTEGWVSFEMSFDVSAEVDPAGEDIVSAIFQVRFRDLDLNPVVTSSMKYQEFLAISFVQDAGGPMPLVPDLILDETNYGLYRGDGFGPTNNVTVLYEFEENRFGTGPLGVTGAEFDNLQADGEFGLWVTLSSKMEHLRERTDTFRNTSETIQENDFVFVQEIPEPGTIVLLASGAAVALLRRRRRCRTTR